MAVRVQTEDFDPAVELAALGADRPNLGAMVSFIGLVRDRADGVPVLGLELEHYPGMTEQELTRIEAEANRRWPLAASLMIHRVGALRPGDRIVLIAVASAHRDAAFDACRFLIDTLKAQVPIWKSERTVEGSRWL